MSIAYRLAVALLGGLGVATAASCKPDVQDGTAGGGGEGGSEPAPIVTTLMPNAPPLPGFTECKVTITDNVKFEGHNHQPLCTAINYVSNPPSSGDHWPAWAQFKEYTAAVPREMYVHDLEHGAIVMLFNCPSGCTDVVSAFEKARTDFGIDPVCVTAFPTGPSARIVITPDPKIPTPLAVTAWRATYVATCIDPPSLLDFVKNHYGKGTEETCYDGKDPATPESGVPACFN